MFESLESRQLMSANFSFEPDDDEASNAADRHVRRIIAGAGRQGLRTNRIDFIGSGQGGNRGRNLQGPEPVSESDGLTARFPPGVVARPAYFFFCSSLNRSSRISVSRGI